MKAYINGITFTEPVFNASSVASTYVFSESGERYLIDPSESSLRSLTGRSGISFNKTRTILVSSLDWDCIGGVIGVCLTFAQYPTPTKIYGPKGIFQLFGLSKAFQNIPNVEVYELDDFNSTSLKNEVFTMVTLPIFKDRSKRTTPLIDDNQIPELNVKQPKPVHLVLRPKPKKNNSNSNNNNNNNNNTTNSTTTTTTFPIENKPNEYINQPLTTGAREFDNDTIICYIGHTKDMESRLFPERAAKLGVTTQRKLGILARGSPVESDDPNNPILIHPDQVRDPPQPGSSFAYINCPDEGYFESLFNHPAWDCIKNGDKPLTVIYHRSPRSVLENPKYISFMESISHYHKPTYSTTNNENNTTTQTLPTAQLTEAKPILEADPITGKIPHATTKHILLDSEFTNIHPNVLKSCNIFRDRLKLLIPDLANHNNNNTNTNSDKDNNKITKTTTTTSEEWKPTPINQLKGIKKSEKLSGNIFEANHLVRTLLTPPQFRGDFVISQEIQTKTEELQYVLDDYFTEQGAGSKLSTSMKELSKSLDKRIANKPESVKYPKTLFLGTASSIPSEHRNVTGILISSDEKNHFLLDCGESTLVQMERFFGRNNLKRILVDLKMIWVSHPHADHHLGIPSVLLARDKAFKELYGSNSKKKLDPIVVVAPKSIINWLVDFKSSVLLKLNFIPSIIGQDSKELDKVCKKLSIVGLTNVPVIHCIEAFGLVVDFKDGFRLTYSGDTRPSHLLEQAGQDSDLLIHEATFSEDDYKEAIHKRHSTLDEALGVSLNMRAKKTILTHFSQRYQFHLRSGQQSKVPYGLAYDLVRFSPYQADLLYNVKECLDHYYQDLSVAKFREKEIIYNLPKTKKPSGFKNSDDDSFLNNNNKNNNNNNTLRQFSTKTTTTTTPTITNNLFKNNINFNMNKNSLILSYAFKTLLQLKK